MTKRERGKAQDIEGAEHTSVREHPEMTRQHSRSPAKLRMTKRERGKAQDIEGAEHTSVCEHPEMTRQHSRSPA
ncbi:hypothetical protein ABQG65_07350 [Yersinia alsatica]|uniref:hypothetical protein n=1 Tax=Yersinia alsatica TaxID=2890317 RepID=UPI0032EF5EA3